MDSTKNSLERQNYHLHKQGYENIVKAIGDIPKTEITVLPSEVSINMDETNKILTDLVSKMNEPICVKLILK